MFDTTNISKFKSLTVSEKITFFDIEIVATIDELNDQQLYLLLKEIIVDPSENSYIRKRALEVFINCVFLKRIKVRQALSLLIDEWADDDDLFLRLQRLKELFFFYSEGEQEISNIFIGHLKDDETEIASEAYFNLGLIEMQKGFASTNKQTSLDHLYESEKLFKLSNEIIENRIDSEIFKLTVSIIIAAINSLWGNVEASLKELSNLLFKKEANAFSFCNNPFYISFYRALGSLQKIKGESVNSWLDFRRGLTALYAHYSEIVNQEIKNRLNQSSLSSLFTMLLTKEFLEPYFALNFHSQISKIDTRLSELDLNNEEFHFLCRVKELASNQDYKKKVETDSIKGILLNTFPNRSSSTIEKVLQMTKDIPNTLDLLMVYSQLVKPSFSDMLDKLMYACLLMQGNILYRGGCLEDNRNTFISNLLETSGYTTKDQTRWSKSNEGKTSGEIDIFIREKDGKPYSIIEALNLDSLKTDYTILHIDKIFKYDTSGLESNFILVYSTAKDFQNLWLKYIKFISQHSYQYKLLSFQEIMDYPYTDIKIGKAIHFRNGREVFLYHLMVDLK